MKNSIKQVEKGMYNKQQVLIAVSATTLSLFSYQFLLTRLFSTLLNYHYVFIVVSLAIMGMGLGGIVLYRYGNKFNEGVLGIFLPLSYLTAVSFVYFAPFKLPVPVYPVITAVPFVLGGMLVSKLFRDYGYLSPVLYFADLFGSAMGSILIVNLFNRVGFINSIVLVAGVSLIAPTALTTSRKKVQMLCTAITLVLAALFVSGITASLENNFFAYYTTPYSITNYFGEGVEVKERIEYTLWDSVSRTDVIFRGDEKERTIITDGGAAAPMVRFGGDLKEIEYLKDEERFIPFSFGSNNSSLLIGSGGGKDVLFALLGGSKDIDAVEINPSIIKAVDKYKDYNGNIYNYEGVSLYVQDGRKFVENSSKLYDNIYLSMVMTASIKSNSLMLAENFIFTEEAFESYFEHLKDGGKLSFMLHNQFDLIRALNTGVKALINSGVKEEDVSRHFVIINGMNHRGQGGHAPTISMPVLVFKKEQFNAEELDTLNEVVSAQGRQYIHLPGGMEIDLYRTLGQEGNSYDELLKKFAFNANPVVDDSPFFYNYDRFVPKLLLAIIAAAIIAVIMFSRFSGHKISDSRILYFSALGIAYMMVEIPVIQKLSMYFGSPSLSFSVAVPVILASSGIGSLVSRSRQLNKDGRYVPEMAAAIGIILMFIGLNYIAALPGPEGLPDKIILAALVLLPAGFFMGMPFPSAIARIKSSREDRVIPFMWGVNGLASVLGSTLATVFSMKFGFNTAILAGAAVYTILFFSGLQRKLAQ